jgi:hypothetical protein
MIASRTRPRAGGFRIGLVVCTVVVLTAACGSIDVVTGDGGGSGGSPGGGSGGMHAGGSGGSAGAHGSGGAQGSGGTIGGGTGGTNRGSGGSNGGGTGGTLGSGGSSGAGGAGGSGPSCSSLQKAFTVALANAKSCVVGGTGYCGVVTADKLECGCPTHVNDTKDIDAIRTQWAQSGCSGGVCPGLLCVAYKGATCTVPSGGTSAVCTDSVSPSTP